MPVFRLVIIITDFCTPNRPIFCSQETSLSWYSNRVFLLDFYLRQPTLTQAELLEFFPVCYTEKTAALLSDLVVRLVLREVEENERKHQTAEDIRFWLSKYW